MRRAIAITFSFMTLLAVPAKLMAQSGSAQPSMTTHHVSGSIYMLEDRGGNIGVSVGEDGILIVDDQFANSAPKIRAALAELGEGNPQFLLNTHHHFDHTGSNKHFGEEAVIIAHENVRKRLAAPENHVPHELPVITFEDSLSIHFNGEEIRLRHYPHGHTDNDSVIFFMESNVVHMGDLLFSSSYPSLYPAQGGNALQYAANVGDVIEAIEAQMKPGVKIIAGHGPLATLDDVKAFHAMWTETLAIVRDRIGGGMSLEQIQAEGLPSKYDRWTSPFTSTGKWLKVLHEGLISEPAATN